MDNLAYFNEKEYIEGFNLGYKVARDFPELAEFIQHAKGVSDKLDGIKDGREQYLEEQLKEKEIEHEKPEKTNRLNWLNDDRLKGKDADPTKDKDIEPEI